MIPPSSHLFHARSYAGRGVRAFSLRLELRRLLFFSHDSHSMPGTVSFFFFLLRERGVPFLQMREEYFAVPPRPMCASLESTGFHWAGYGHQTPPPLLRPPLPRFDPLFTPQIVVLRSSVSTISYIFSFFFSGSQFRRKVFLEESV